MEDTVEFENGKGGGGFSIWDVNKFEKICNPLGREHLDLFQVPFRSELSSHLITIYQETKYLKQN